MTRREMRREIDDLRAALELSEFRTIEEWERIPAIRDSLAARAYIAEWRDKSRALIRLGFPGMNRLPPGRVSLYHDYAARVFDTPGVQATLKRELARFDPDREAIIARTRRTALYGDDGESVRAATLLMKVCGWDRGDSRSAGPSSI